MTDKDPTERFSNRADVYARARPSYPQATITLLETHHHLERDSVVADVGSGTGIFTRLLLGSAARVYAVEPNSDMRAEAEKALASNSRFVSVAGRAEATTLEAQSLDLVVAAQAFHWFDVAKAAVEHRRILKPGAHAAMIWNDRDLDGTSFLREFEAILVEHCPGYRLLQGKADTPDKFDAYWGVGAWTRHTSQNEQSLDRELLVARVMSASYAPSAGTKEHEALVTALEQSFDRHAEAAPAASGSRMVKLIYTTVVIGGPLR